jgi:tetratricopeptide (TPR) repeat protein
MLLRQARVSAARGDTATAKRICDQLLLRQPHHPPTLLFRSELAMMERSPEALTFLARIGDEQALASTARHHEGVVLYELGRARQAEQALRRSLALDPAGTASELKLRELYMLQLRRGELRELLRARRSVRIWTLFDLLDFLVVGHTPNLLLGNWLARIETFTRQDPDDVASRIALAQYYSGSGRYADSAETARALLAGNAGHRKAQALLADAWLNLGQMDDARAVLESIPEMVDEAWVWRARGRLAAGDGNHARAAACFEQALRLAPGDPMALYPLGLALERVGTGDRARRLVRSGQQLTTLLTTVQRIAQQANERTADAQSLHAELIQLGELMLDAELPEDAMYCFELVVQRDGGHEQAAALHRRARDLWRRAPPESSQPLTAANSVQPAGNAPESAAGSKARPQPSVEVVRPAAVLRFDNVASMAGIDFVYFPGNTGKKYLFETVGGGVCVLDYDADGWPDLYFGQGCRFPMVASDTAYRDVLYRNVAGKFQPVTEAAGVGDPAFTLGCAAGDFDNDGFTDLFLSNYGPNRAYRNNGDGTFSDVSTATGAVAPQMSTSLALADLDRDGDLDLYVTNYLAGIDTCPDRSGKVWSCHPSMFPAEQDRLYENTGDGRFVDVTDRCGILCPDGKGLGVVVADLDNDGWPDIYVANDTTPNFLFHNQGGAATGSSGPRPSGDAAALRFVECGLRAGAAVSRDGVAQAGMGIACADLDDNGYLDLYVTNFYLETNALYLNQGSLWFIDSARPAVLVAETNPWLGFGAQALDADLDGHLDLFVTNGHIDDYREKDPMARWKMPAKLYRGSGKLAFADVSAAAGDLFRGEYLGRGVARLDWNRDARPDLVVVHQNDPAALLENRTDTECNAVVLDFVGTTSNRDASNVRYWVTAGGTRRMFEIAGGDGFLATNERRQMVGLGGSVQVDRLEVAWPSGRRDHFDHLAAPARIRFTEGRPPRIESARGGK